MVSIGYRDLAEFGVPFATPKDADFPALLRDIEGRWQMFEHGAADGRSAVLINNSGKSIVALAYIWRYKTANGETRISYHSNLSSSMQMDVFSGRIGAVHDAGSFIMPGSKRLITEDGMYGNNFDVLSADSAHRRGGGVGAGMGRGGWRNRGEDAQYAQIELQLDVVFFDDGLCAGPDDTGLFESVREDLEQQLRTAQQVVQARRSGASWGAVFEILRPLARRSIRHIPGRDCPADLLFMFANVGIDHIINDNEPEVLAWFEDFAKPSSFHVRRPA
ncbi:MAG TPA: hypothetical protein VN737_13600 [Bryobacteraceae bacterium]|nr:hypothetical protein [Bryobacteraceae bacterium]